MRTSGLISGVFYWSEPLIPIFCLKHYCLNCGSMNVNKETTFINRKLNCQNDQAEKLWLEVWLQCKWSVFIKQIQFLPYFFFLWFHYLIVKYSVIQCIFLYYVLYLIITIIFLKKKGRDKMKNKKILHHRNSSQIQSKNHRKRGKIDNPHTEIHDCLKFLNVLLLCRCNLKRKNSQKSVAIHNA